MRVRHFVLLTCSLVISLSAFGQSSDQRLMASLSGLFLDYNGPLNGDYLDYQNFSPGINLGTHIYLTAPVGLSINTAFAPQVKLPGTNTDLERPSLIDANALVRFKLNNGRILPEDAFFAPYLTTGLGLNSMRSELSVYVPAALGVRFRISSNFSFQLESMYKQAIGRKHQHIAHSFGVVFSVPSSQPGQAPEEELPEIQAPEPVVAQATAPISAPDRGLDSDGDGIPDLEDSCPETMGLIQFGGCPPKIADPMDGPIAQVEDKAFGVDPAILPSSEPRLQVNTGTTGEDQTRSPDQGEEKSLEISKEDAEYLDFAVQNIYFEMSSDELKTESFPVLDKIADILEKYPRAQLKITGHTDDVGDEKDNLILSIKRAFKVKYYLVKEKGIRLSRIDSDGFGEQQPIANNDSQQGRQLNRRVQFELLSSSR